ncbi:hypothetical protein EDF67_103305 [Sphingobacterium sp. JUb78]|nr:hypothetical protein [Sphingobacterium kitahiroshimense]TCR11892.1 hypothetical protein EDF67_103305 [Sphingobacterium sp. JUb78]
MLEEDLDLPALFVNFCDGMNFPLFETFKDVYSEVKI